MWSAARLTAIAIVPTVLMPLTAIAADPVSPTPDPVTTLSPRIASVMVFDTRQQTWQQLEQYALFQVLQEDSNAPLNVGTLPFLPLEIDYDTEVAPWIGETFALAQLSVGQGQVFERNEYEVMVAPILTPEALPDLVERITTLRELEPLSQTYRGVTLVYWEPVYLEDEEIVEQQSRLWLPTEEFVKALPEDKKPDLPLLEGLDFPDVPGLAIAILPDYLVTAESPAAIRRWLDQQPANPENSLVVEPDFQRTLARATDKQSFGLLYGNIDEMLKYSVNDFLTLEDILPVPLPDVLLEFLAPQDAAQLVADQLKGTVEVLLYPQTEGIRVQGRAYFDNPLFATGAATIEPVSAEILNVVPSASYIMVSGRGLADAWAQISMLLESSEALSPWLTQFRTGFQTFTGLDFDTDLIGWMDESFTVFLFPTRETPFTLLLPSLEVGIGVAIETSDRPKAESTLRQLDEALGQGFLSVQTSTLNNAPASSWGLGPAGPGQSNSFLGHGWFDDNTFVMTSSIESLQDVFALSTRNKLPGSPVFRRAVSDFPTTNQGYFYANLSSTLSLVFNLFPLSPGSEASSDETPEFDMAQFGRILGTIQTLSTTFSVEEEFVQLDALLMLSPSDR
ncbi:MAG: DUF3352 domain-containing protein [Leptolyngbyaceae cyanobacterium T60_A2020_046]|nr:DUF3352 domain-containing protein [Leptolyngbyaceae cyanobacterium T60_A2020_046]